MNKFMNPSIKASTFLQWLSDKIDKYKKCVVEIKISLAHQWTNIGFLKPTHVKNSFSSGQNMRGMICSITSRQPEITGEGDVD
jgi:hypothetical protein